MLCRSNAYSLLLCASIASAPSFAAGDHDEHAAHRAAAAATLKISAEKYTIPAATLLDEHGSPVRLRELLRVEQPVIVNFIYTSCTTICPVMTATLSQLQRELAGSTPAPRYITVSIDPDFDTAAVLREYATHYGADWTFLTGDRDTVLQVLQAFDAWRGAKSNHVAITLFRKPGSSDWTRIEGLTSAQRLAHLWLHGDAT